MSRNKQDNAAFARAHHNDLHYAQDGLSKTQFYAAIILHAIVSSIEYKHWSIDEKVSQAVHYANKLDSKLP